MRKAKLTINQANSQIIVKKKGVNILHSITVRTDKDGKVYHDITLTRGNNLFLQLSLKKNNQSYTPAQGSSIRFAMKAKYTDPDTEVLINKSIPIDTLLLAIEPEDTKGLPMGRTYVYDMQLTDENGFVDTFAEGKFTVDKEVI